MWLTHRTPVSQPGCGGVWFHGAHLCSSKGRARMIEYECQEKRGGFTGPVQTGRMWVCGCGGRAGQRRVEKLVDLWTCRCTKHAAMTVSVFLKDCILLPRCLTTSRACSPKTARARCTPQNNTTTWPSAVSSLPPDPTAASVRPGAADTLCMHTNQPPSSS